MPTKNISEKDLYAPVKQFFEEKGFSVKGEVNHCDLVAMDDENTMIVVELKIGLNLELFLQATDRLLLTDQVYVAFPLPKTTNSSAFWNRKRRSILRLCRRIGIGLIAIHSHRVKHPYATLMLEPAPYTPRKNYKKSKALKKEFDKREGDFNLGGTTAQPIVTAYRQEAIRCAQILKMHGPLKIAQIKQFGAGSNAGNILRDNHYGWFDKVSRGVYRINPSGMKGLEEFHFVAVKLDYRIG